MGSIVTGVASLFGGKKRREAEKTTQAAFNAANTRVDNFNFDNAFANLQQGQYTPGKYTPESATASTLGDPTLAQEQTLASAQGYDPTGYADQLTKANVQETNVAGLARGADTGLTNTMSNLQVSTAGARLAAQEADQSLAASQDLAAQAGTGAGGATALAAAAAKSKAGISADIDKQVRQNEMMRARGESELQRSQLAQSNLSSQFDLKQDQFNVSSQNRAEQFNAQSANQAARFGAQAANDAEKFQASARNQFNLSRFAADNARERFNVGSQNQFAQSQFATDNRFELANTQFANQGSQFDIQNQIGADRFSQQSMMQNQMAEAQGNQFRQTMEYDREQQRQARAAGEFQAAKDARAQAKADALGGIGGLLDVGMTIASGGLGGGKLFGKAAASDRRLKNNIKLIGYSPLGIKIYKFKYKNNIFGKGFFQGVMSDEIPSEAVIKHSDGYDIVDYSKIDVEFKNI